MGENAYFWTGVLCYKCSEYDLQQNKQEKCHRQEITFFIAENHCQHRNDRGNGKSNKNICIDENSREYMEGIDWKKMRS